MAKAGSTRHAAATMRATGHAPVSVRSSMEQPPPASPAPSTPPPADAPLVEVSALQQAVARFVREREWERFHSPKNLAMALAGEVGELLELFQWLSEDESREVARNPATARAVRDEIADVLVYLVRLAAVLEVDLDEALRSKLAANAAKYPVALARGNASKYSRR
jgi:NTP pyrophosphatase (non-canonical NTP hydrolase)